MARSRSTDAGRVRRSAAEVARRTVIRCAAAAVALSAAGCAEFGTDGLLLRADDSIELTAPVDGAEVSAPLQVSWTDDAPRAGGGYVVLLDRAPMPPGEDVAWFARDDDTCLPNQGCPDEVWLARRGITVTSETSVSVAILPARAESREGAPYDVTVVRLDAEGRRDGEAAFSVQVRLADGDG